MQKRTVAIHVSLESTKTSVGAEERVTDGCGFGWSTSGNFFSASRTYSKASFGDI